MLGLPFVLLSTWVHELGHGLGAIVSGGRFESMIITPGLSGLAHTFSGSDFERIIVLLGGLLGPSIAGAVMLVLSRRMGLNRLALYLLAGALLVTVVFWAGDMFTRVTVLSFGVAVTAMALMGHSALRHLFAHIIAISFCLNAVAQLDYVFMRNANVGSYAGQSDTGALADIIGGHMFSGPSLSALCLYLYCIWRSNCPAGLAVNVIPPKHKLQHPRGLVTYSLCIKDRMVFLYLAVILPRLI